MKITNKYGLQIELKVGEYRTLPSGEVGRVSGFQYLPERMAMFLLQDGQHRMAYPNDVLTEQEQRIGEPCKATCPTCSKEFMRGIVAALFDPRFCSPECEAEGNRKYAEEKSKRLEKERVEVAEKVKKIRSSKKEEVESNVEG